MAEALFHPDSVTWRINQEPVLLLGGGRALLMQLAHPGVAAGVAEHSDFRDRPLGRLLRTLELTLALTFGTREEALAAARQINLVHQRVRGSGYRASDPRLLLWVHATLIDSALTTYGAFVRPLAADEREAYYQEAKLVGGLLGLGSSRYPATLADFQEYVDGMLAGPELQVDTRARELARAVLRPPLRRVPAAAFLPLEAITVGLLPPRLRLDYGLRWGGARRLGYGAVRAGLPRALRLVPRRLRQLPPARLAHRASSTLGSRTGRSS
jgi:uncharacterized protein (DUF2236 family)